MIQHVCIRCSFSTLKNPRASLTACFSSLCPRTVKLHHPCTLSSGCLCHIISKLWCPRASLHPSRRLLLLCLSDPELFQTFFMLVVFLSLCHSATASSTFHRSKGFGSRAGLALFRCSLPTFNRLLLLPRLTNDFHLVANPLYLLFCLW